MKLKRALLGVLAVVLVSALGLFMWARSILAQDTVRMTIAARLSEALGQPVTIASIGAGIYPRVTVHLTGVTIGQPPAITVASLGIGTDFRALLSRRIEHGTMRLSGARIRFPLPTFAGASRPQPASPSPPSPSSPSSPVEIVSIDEIALKGVEVVSGGRTLHGDIEVVPRGSGLDVKNIALGADKATVKITGHITTLAGPTGALTLKAGDLDLSQLLAFISDFSKGFGGSDTPARAANPSAPPSSSTLPSAMDLTVMIDADRASLGTLLLEKLSGRARFTAAGMTLDPAAFKVFGGRYDGSLALTLDNVPDFRLKARLSGIDMAAATTFAGTPNTLTGRMSGTLDVSGSGVDAGTVSRTANGTLQLDVADGVVKNLGLIQAVVLATSMRSDAFARGTGSRDEPFTHLGGTLAIGHGEGTTSDLRFVSKDVDAAVTGAVRLDGSAVDMKGVVQLSEALSKQAAQELVRYTQEQGRVTLPLTVRGAASSPQARIDVEELAKRALRNRANEEGQNAITKALSGIFKKR